MIFDNFENFDSHQRLWVHNQNVHNFCDFDDFDFTTLINASIMISWMIQWRTKILDYQANYKKQVDALRNEAREVLAQIF